MSAQGRKSGRACIVRGRGLRCTSGSIPGRSFRTLESRSDDSRQAEPLILGQGICEGWPGMQPKNSRLDVLISGEIQIAPCWQSSDANGITTLYRERTKETAIPGAKPGHGNSGRAFSHKVDSGVTDPRRAACCCRETRPDKSQAGRATATRRQGCQISELTGTVAELRESAIPGPTSYPVRLRAIVKLNTGRVR